MSRSQGAGRAAAALGAVMWRVAGAWAEPIVIETVPVGHPGNFSELSGEGVEFFGAGLDRLCGAVNYAFEIGRFEVTAAQYVAFLNAVAADDTYGLWATAMAPGELYAGHIARSGEPGSYTYSVAPDWANRPVTFVGWGDAARFANWMHNGQPAGAQDLTTTEGGSYFVNGAVTNQALMLVTRTPAATWVIPTEDEWYKAAYHFNDGATGNYWDFPTQFNTDFFLTMPGNDIIDPDPGNNACTWIPLNDNCLGPPYWRTEVGEFENSGSPYGTFDQGGNVWEWTESYASPIGTPGQRTYRGGSFYNLLDGPERMAAGWREYDPAIAQLGRRGFRLARVANDCNGNGILDQAELASAPGADANYNFIPDDCDIAAGASEDCNGNGIPDEAELGDVSPTAYRWDDFVAETDLGAIEPGGVAWLSQYTIQPGRETIDRIAVVFGPKLGNITALVCLWADPDNDGIPFDAVVLASVTTPVVGFGGDPLLEVDIPDTFVGPPGTSFFAGAVIQQPPGGFPMTIDLTSSQGRSWTFLDPNGIDPDALAVAELSGTIDSLGYPGNWMLRALPLAAVTPSGDDDGDGVLDACACPWDLTRDGDVGVADFLALLAAWGPASPGPPDFDGDGSVGVQDFLALLSNWGACP
jgi:formylglycine-generating enzyme required for sulfatase activity